VNYAFGCRMRLHKFPNCQPASIAPGTAAVGKAGKMGGKMVAGGGRLVRLGCNIRGALATYLV